MGWSEDLALTFGEHQVQPTEIITVQPPATPGIAGIYLRAYRVLGDAHYLDVAEAAGKALITGQLDCGGFPHEFKPGDSKSRSGTFDDDVSQSATRFLMDLWSVTKNPAYQHAAQRCLQFMLDAQYANGGWPQAYPLRNNTYSNYITLNDDAMMDVIRTLFQAAKVFDEPAYAKAAIRGADCLLALQGDEPQGGWAQQYTPDGFPAPARRFEPVALSSHETGMVLRMLAEVYRETGDKKYLRSGKRAFDWLKRSRLANGKWARFYEYKTNHDLYCTEKGEIIRDVAHARPGYGWQGMYYSEAVEALFHHLLALPVAEREQAFVQSKPNRDRLLERVLPIMEEMDAQGRWLDPISKTAKDVYASRVGEVKQTHKIDSGTFVRNVGSMVDYLSVRE